MEEAHKNEFDFYVKFTKPLILNLGHPEERMKAAAWVKRLQDESIATEDLRTEYLKLLLFTLQRRKLVGIFGDSPETYNVLENFPGGLGINDIAKALLEDELLQRKERIVKMMTGEMGEIPPFTTDCSADMKEYAAAQDIPNFGVHAYYAISKEPLNLWRNSDKILFPKGAKHPPFQDPEPEQGAGPSSASAPCITCSPRKKSKAGDEPSAAEVVEGAASAEEGSVPCASKIRRRSSTPKKKKKQLGKTPPVTPIGVVQEPEERLPPTWGTNLVEVVEPLEPVHEKKKGSPQKAGDSSSKSPTSHLRSYAESSAGESTEPETNISRRIREAEEDMAANDVRMRQEEEEALGGAALVQYQPRSPDKSPCGSGGADQDRKIPVVTQLFQAAGGAARDQMAKQGISMDISGLDYGGGNIEIDESQLNIGDVNLQNLQHFIYEYKGEPIHKQSTTPSQEQAGTAQLPGSAPSTPQPSGSGMAAPGPSRLPMPGSSIQMTPPSQRQASPQAIRQVSPPASRETSSLPPRQFSPPALREQSLPALRQPSPTPSRQSSPSRSFQSPQAPLQPADDQQDDSADSFGLKSLADYDLDKERLEDSFLEKSMEEEAKKSMIADIGDDAFNQLVGDDEEGLQEALHVSVHEAGVGEDLPTVNRYDEIKEKTRIEDEATRLGQSFRQVSPALSAGVPVTTPRYSPAPRRPISPERLFKEEGDDFVSVSKPKEPGMNIEQEQEMKRLAAEAIRLEQDRIALAERVRAQEAALLASPIVRRGTAEARRIATEAVLEVNTSRNQEAERKETTVDQGAESGAQAYGSTQQSPGPAEGSRTCSSNIQPQQYYEDDDLGLVDVDALGGDGFEDYGGDGYAFDEIFEDDQADGMQQMPPQSRSPLAVAPPPAAAAGPCQRASGIRPPGGASGLRPPGGVSGIRPPGGASGIRPPGGPSGSRIAGVSSGIRPPASASQIRQPGAPSGIRPPGAVSRIRPPGVASLSRRE